jgi:type IV pilus assembly protein PilA
METLRKRFDRSGAESGFTLIELLVVLVILGVLLAIAVPSYLGFRQRAEVKAAESNVRAALPTVETYYADNGSYNSMDFAALQSIDQGINKSISVTAASSTGYTICDNVGTHYATVDGPGGSIDSATSC